MHVFTVVGARPQFVKAAVVSRALSSARAEETLVHTGQHFDAQMSDVFFAELGLPPPARHLGIGGLSHGAMTGRMLEALEALLIERRPDVVLVYGDTNSTLAGALAAAKLHIPVAHVEAGMRSFDRRMPEEINRVLTDHLSSLLLVTGENPAKLLAAEGIENGVHVVGDVMLDALQVYREAAERTGARRRLGLSSGYALATLHRAENTDDEGRLAEIVDALSELAAELPVVVPLHPRTKKALSRHGLAGRTQALTIIDPIGYLEMLDCECGARLILTDSGGVQKEAFWQGVPCVTLRDVTEWTETVEHGYNRLAGADRARILEHARAFLERRPDGSRPPLYGDGKAAERVADLLGRV
jgi:UDP-GlcNAc3NAcA epimerase